MLINILIRFFSWMYYFSYHKLSALAILDNNGIHPKHKILNYYQFFTDNIDKNDVVLDVGCGDGYNTKEIAKKAKRIVGVDNNSSRIDKAKRSYAAKNITYLFGDVMTFSFGERFDRIVLSNVLEHIKSRHEFLLSLHNLTTILLIRVPLLTRDWLPAYLKSKNIDYRLDPTHHIEFTEENFKRELSAAKWNIKKISIQFGEIWAVAG